MVSSLKTWNHGNCVTSRKVVIKEVHQRMERLFVHAKGILDLVAAVEEIVSIQESYVHMARVLHGAGGTAIVVIMDTLGLVKGLLGTALAVVRLETTSHAVTSVGDSLLDLVLGGLAGVRSHLLLGL